MSQFITARYLSKVEHKKFLGRSKQSVFSEWKKNNKSKNSLDKASNL